MKGLQHEKMSSFLRKNKIKKAIEIKNDQKKKRNDEKNKIN